MCADCVLSLTIWLPPHSLSPQEQVSAYHLFQLLQGLTEVAKTMARRLVLILVIFVILVIKVRNTACVFILIAANVDELLRRKG